MSSHKVVVGSVAFVAALASAQADGLAGLPPEFSGPGASCVIPEPPKPTCFEINLSQPEGAQVSKVDVLFVTEVMRKSQLRPIADGITKIASELDDLDLRVAAMAAAGSVDGSSGELVVATNEPEVLDFMQMTPETLWYWLALKLAKSREAGIAAQETGADRCSLMTALSEEKLETSRGQGFFRTDAALAIIVDPDTGCEPEALFARLSELQGDRPLILAGLSQSAGSAAKKLVGFANGVLGADMGEIGRTIMRKINLKTEIALEHALSLIDAGSVQTTVDGQKVDHEISRSANKVLLTGSAGGNGSRVQVSYCLDPRLAWEQRNPTCQSFEANSK